MKRQYNYVDIIERLLSQSQNKPLVPIADKILLKLSEAQALTGLSKGILRTAIKEGKLKAEKIGSTWRIKRSDLDEFVAELF
ncbi:DNA-binding protein [Brasilonema sp. UFV-L1]|nr:DNA-binding protein [Brasilonema sp. UFV-L1]